MGEPVIEEREIRISDKPMKRGGTLFLIVNKQCSAVCKR
jgi:hypothetical protein